MSIAASLGRSMKQTATYWANAASYDKYGDPTFSVPVRIPVRWESKTELFIDKNGEQSHSRAVVYSLTAITVDSYLFLGKSTTTNPESVSGSDKVRRVDAVPDLKNTTTLYKAFL